MTTSEITPWCSEIRWAFVELWSDSQKYGGYLIRTLELDKIPYRFLSTNSNAAVTQALEAAHLPVPTPPVSAPGWGTPLGPFAGNSPIGPASGGGGGGGFPK